VFLGVLVDFRRVAIDSALRGRSSRLALTDAMQLVLQSRVKPRHFWQSPLRCAVVGNAPRRADSVVLDEAAAIDAHDVVMRFNRPQSPLVAMAGERTTLRFVNVAFLDAPALFAADSSDELLVAHTTRANRTLEHAAAAEFCRRLGDDRCIVLNDALVDGVASLLPLPATSHPRTGVLGVAAAYVLSCQLPVAIFRFGRANETVVASDTAIDPHHRHEFDAEEQLLTQLEHYRIAQRH